MNPRKNRPEYIKHKLANVINISKIVTIHYHEFDKNFHFSGEVHDFWELVYVDSGKVIITADKETYTLCQGEIIFHKPNEFHTISSDKKSPSNVFVITFVSNSKNMMYFKNKKIKLPTSLRPYIETILSEGRSAFNLSQNNPQSNRLILNENAPFGGQQIILTILEQLLIMIIRTQDEKAKEINVFSDKEGMDNHLVDSVIKLLKDNIYGKITVNEICQELNYSKTYISKIFNKICGCTIIEYYTNLKLKEAKILIRKNIYSISEVSDILCFNNPHYFSRVFKKHINMTPREYMNSVSK